MKTLLVAVDNSATARKVISLAAEQGLAQRATVVVLCCVDLSYSTTGPYEIAVGEDPADFGCAQDEQGAAAAVVRQALSELKDAGVSARGKVVPGEPAETIVAQAKELNASMIIMGRRHLSPFNRLLRGSHSALVIENADCPVLIDVRAD
ncbi:MULTISPECIES: universal stress protein [Serratia]|uniref:universal stress protein n=1 Tax=Serratia TaxID=613 RepID=UPI00061B6D2E|nr:MULTISPECIES: universal stress protein [Serratia]AKE11545.1 universal stress protein [Serratia liquefaciens]MCS4316006.1 nucleotide-binding universal stress UspA family protein [Serratia sp. BIGb0234]CAI1604061.1 universal stress protein F [Serratia liquefaciens]CAI1780625.1 universal stress protein F [Serratia liquefaciens]CAI2470987.1 universal stress protein F [Serratia liquefaciens]